MKMKHDHDACDCSRRGFLKGSGLGLAGLGMGGLFGGSLIGPSLANCTTPSNKKMVFIFLRGGADGLNMIIPHGDVDYNTTNRPTLYIDPMDAVDLQNGFCNLHPSMADLMDVHNAGDLALIHRVGYPGQSRSHFDSMRIWENGDPNMPSSFEGWLYRYVKANCVDTNATLPVLSAQNGPPLLIRGAERFVNIANPNDFDYDDGDPRRAKYTQAWRRMYDGLSGPFQHRPALRTVGVRTIDTVDEYRDWDQANWNPTDPNTGNHLFPVDQATNPDSPQGGKMFGGGDFQFFRQLKVCALALLESPNGENGTRIVGSQIGGWDHHATQGRIFGSHPNLLKRLSYGIRSLWVALSGTATDEPRNYPSIWNDTIVVTLTEFGRTSKENGSQGTDHAEAAPVICAGGGVNGAVYNCDATTWGANNGVMFGANGRYLSHATDYRALMWEIMRDHMGADIATVDTIFPGYSQEGLTELGFLL